MTITATRTIGEEEAAKYRSEFPIFAHTTYLNSCSLGPLSKRGIDALAEYRDDWSFYGAPAWWTKWMPQLDAARERFAQLIGADSHEVTISHSASSALSSIASTFDYSRRHAVVCSDLDFPTIPYQWLAKEREGVDVRYARSLDHIRVPMGAYENQFGDDVACVATSHGFYSTGYLQPIRSIADLAHSHGSKIVVDGYHAVGVVPVDVKALEVDFYVGGTLKWLLGGPGLTFIYVREELISELRPTITGWFASENQFAFDNQHLDLAASANRLELGTPSVATAYAGIAGMDMIIEAEPDRIWQRLRMLTSRVIERAHAAGFGVMSPENSAERGGIVMLAPSAPQQTVAALADRGFTVDYRPGLVRVSPHFFNTLEDVDRLMDEMVNLQQELAGI